MEVELVDADDYDFLERVVALAEQQSARHHAPPPAGRSVPPSFVAGPAPPPLPPLAFRGHVRYLCTPYDVDAAATRLLHQQPLVLGWDIEWRVTYRTGQAPRPVALIQFCFAAPSSAAASAPAHTCLLLQVARSGLTPALREVLCCEGLLKVGVGAHGDALKMGRDYPGLEMRGVLDLSEYANARLCSDAPGGLAPQKWSLASLSERLLRGTVAKPQSLRCGDWEAPLTAEQQRYAATDAWASLRLHEVLAQMPVIWHPPTLDALPADGQPGACASAQMSNELVPACARLQPLQPAKLAVFELHARQGWTFAQIAAHRRIQEDTAQAYCAEAIAAGHAYSWRSLGVPEAVLRSVASVSQELLGRAMSSSVPVDPGEPVDVLAALLATVEGGGIRQLREARFPPELGYGQLRLALAHLGRCNPGPWGAEDGALRFANGVVVLPPHMCCGGDTLEALVQEVYGELATIVDPQARVAYITERVILTPCDADVDLINKLVSSTYGLAPPGAAPAEHKTCLSAECVVGGDPTGLHPIEFLNSLDFSGVPPHELRLRVGAPIILLRDLAGDLANGARLILIKLGQCHIEAEVATGPSKGERILIPHVDVTPSDRTLPFTMRRRQYPIRPAYAMSMDKSQGQAFKRVGLYLPKPVGSQGQLHTAAARVAAAEGVVVLADS